MLRGPVLEIERYVNLHLTRPKRGDIANYRPDDVAAFHHDVCGVRAKAGDACLVTEVDTAEGRVMLTFPNGRQRRIDPSGYIRYRLDLFETQPMVLKLGERVRWTRNDATHGLINGEHAEILSIGWANVRIKTQDGHELSLKRDDPQLHHLDHAYSSTVHAAHGTTCDRVIAVLDTDRAPADQAMSYLELTRARDNVVLLTDDWEALIETLEIAPGEQISALRAIGEQFEVSIPVSPETALKRPPPEKETVLDEATREKRKAAERFLDRVLTAEASIRLREERAHYAAQDGVHVTLVAGYDDWRNDARRALDGCRRILDEPETFDRHLARRPGAEDDLKRLSSRIETHLKADNAEIERVRLEREAQEKAREREKAKTRDMGGLEL